MKRNNSEQLELIKRIKESKDEEEIRILKGLLLEDYDEMIKDIAKYFDDGTFDIDDIIQEGYLAFICGIDNFDIRKKIKFEDFIHSNVMNKVEKAIEEAKKEKTFPEEVTRKLNKIIDAEEALKAKLKREPSNDEVSEFLGLDFDEYFELKKYALELLSFADTKENMHKSLSELIAIREEMNSSKEESNDKEIDSEEMEFALSDLSEREREILELSLGLNGKEKKTLWEISEMMNISRERVRQIKNLAINKIKRNLDEDYEE